MNTETCKKHGEQEFLKYPSGMTICIACFNDMIVEFKERQSDYVHTDVSVNILRENSCKTV